MDEVHKLVPKISRPSALDLTGASIQEPGDHAGAGEPAGGRIGPAWA
jgi:hypothetical protein